MKIVAIADVHCGAERWGVSPKQWDAPFAEAVEYALDHGAGLFLIAGDLFHRRNPTTEEYMRAIEQIERLSAAGLQVVVVDGNHDTGAAASSVPATWSLQSLAYGQSGRAERLLVAGVELFCLPWPRLSDYARNGVATSLADLIAAARAEVLCTLYALCAHNPVNPRVLLAHCMLSYGGGSEPRDPGLLLGRDIVLPVNALPKMDAYLFGHVHQADQWYLGSTQPTDFSDTGPKSFSVFDLTRQDDGTWASVRTMVPYKSSLKVWDCVVSIDDTTRTKHEIIGAYRIECQRRALEAPRFDVARVRIAAGGVESPDPARVRQLMSEFADRVVSVDVVRPPQETRRIASDGPAIATLSPDAALDAWLQLKETDRALRDRTLVAFRELAANS